MNESLHLDTAIIGGGITGLYACMELCKRKGSDYRIALFEASDRFGGRVETVEMDGFLAEYGPMRFEKRGQPLLMRLIQDMGLETSYFHPYTPAKNLESLFDLEKDENRISHGHPLNTLELLSLGILRILRQSGGDLNNPRDRRHWQWWAGLDEDFYSWIRNDFIFNGKPLYKTGFWNALGEVLSNQALQKIIEYGTFYHVIHFNPNAAEWINFWLRGLHPKEELVGIKQGTEALITGLANQLSALQPRPPGLYLNHSLIAIKQEEDWIHLTLRKNTGENISVRTRHLILAIPQSPLIKLLPYFPESIGRIIESVIPIPLIKCFFVTKKPWWNESVKPQTRSSSIPTRELHYYLREQDGEKRGMVMVYGDLPSLNYWKTFAAKEPHQKAEINLNERLIEQYLKYLSPHPATDTPEQLKAQAQAITCFGIRDWSREPFEAGCHIWKPNVKVDESIASLSSFALTDSTSAYPHIHICGEAYSDFQGFIEGGLRSALTVIKRVE
ncbi:MAG: flavin monoamine oxidase family protein [Methylomonas sp.]